MNKKGISLIIVAMLIGIWIVLIESSYIHVNYRLARIISHDSDTWPNMGPQVVYHLIFYFGIGISVVALIVEAIRTKLGNRMTLSILGAFIVGCSYSTYSVNLSLMYLLNQETAQNITNIAVIIFNPITAYLILGGYRKNEKV